jgi:periplasmic copper chaperone A
VHPALLVAAVTAAVGLAGLWYGHGPGPTAAAGSAAGGAAAGQPGTSVSGQDAHEGHESGSGAGPSAGGTATAGDITVRGGYLREPYLPGAASAYLSIANTGAQPDTLVSAYCGAARNTALRDVPGAATAPSGLVTIGPRATLTLSPGHGRLVLSGLTGALRPGDSVSLLLTFQRSGQVLVELPVLAIGATAPDGSRR